MALFYGLQPPKVIEPLQGGSLLFTAKFTDIPGIHLIYLGMMNGSIELAATQWF